MIQEGQEKNLSAIRTMFDIIGGIDLSVFDDIRVFKVEIKDPRKCEEFIEQYQEAIGAEIIIGEEGSRSISINLMKIKGFGSSATKNLTQKFHESFRVLADCGNKNAATDIQVEIKKFRMRCWKRNKDAKKYYIKTVEYWLKLEVNNTTPLDLFLEQRDNVKVRKRPSTQPITQYAKKAKKNTTTELGT